MSNTLFLSLSVVLATTVACGTRTDKPTKCGSGTTRQGDRCLPTPPGDSAAAGDPAPTASDGAAEEQAGDPAIAVGDPVHAGDNAPGDPAWHDRLVFVTSGAWNGDLKAAGGQATAIASADTLCQSAATTAGLSGSFVAYLSTSATMSTPATNAIERMRAGGPWKNMQGELLWTNLQDFIDDWPAVAVRYDELGNEMDDFEYVWTGSSEAGESSGTDCWGFEMAYDNGAVGDPKATVGFSHKEDKGCGMQMHLYCFEQ